MAPGLPGHRNQQRSSRAHTTVRHTANNWSARGAALGINAPANFTGYLILGQLNAKYIFSVSYDGTVTTNYWKPVYAKQRQDHAWHHWINSDEEHRGRQSHFDCPTATREFDRGHSKSQE